MPPRSPPFNAARRRVRQILIGIRYTLAVICIAVMIGLIGAYPAGGWKQKSFHQLIGRWYFLTGAADGRVWVELNHLSTHPIIGPAVPSTQPSPAYTAFVARYPSHLHWLTRNISVEWGWSVGTDQQGRAVADGGRYVIQMPYWMAICVAAGLSFFLWFGSRPISLFAGCLRPRARSGCCLNCGYDLRATPQRCPECGTVPPPPDGEREESTGRTSSPFQHRAEL